MMEFLDDTRAIDLEVLNNRDDVLSSAGARLNHMDGERASISMASDSGITCLRWGSRVRFRVNDPLHAYEIVGVVTAHDLNPRDRSAGLDEDGDRELKVHLLDCRIVPQRRLEPRRLARLEVRIRAGGPPAHAAFEEGGSAWISARCVDVSPSGMRLRVPAGVDLGERVDLEFVLPAASEARQAVPFELHGRVLRTTVRGRYRDVQELAVKFEHIGPDKGLLLSHYVRG